MSEPELPRVYRLPDGRLIWFVVPDSFDDIRVLENDSWVPLEDVTLEIIFKAQGLSEREIQSMVSAGKFKASRY